MLKSSATTDHHRDHELSFIDACIQDERFLISNLVDLERYVNNDDVE